LCELVANLVKAFRPLDGQAVYTRTFCSEGLNLILGSVNSYQQRFATISTSTHSCIALPVALRRVDGHS